MASRHSLIWLLATCLLLASCRSIAPSSPTPDTEVEETSLPETAFLSPVPLTQSSAMPGLSAEQVRNASYQLGFTDSLNIVKLINGTYQKGSPGDTDYVDVRMTDFIALGDMDGDGVNEAAALVSENYGGSGVFVFLALYVAKNKAPEFLTSVFIDDRPVIEGVGFENNQIFLYTTTHKMGEPMCCPTLRNERHYRLVNNQLDMADYVTFTPDDKPRTLSIESPTDATAVFGSVQIKGSVAIAPFENNLVYRIYDVGGVELTVGSITVATTEPGGPGTFNQTVLLGNILSGAVIRIEVQDVSAADGSLLAMDSVELVVK